MKKFYSILIVGAGLMIAVAIGMFAMRTPVARAQFGPDCLLEAGSVEGAILPNTATLLNGEPTGNFVVGFIDSQTACYATAFNCVVDNTSYIPYPGDVPPQLLETQVCSTINGAGEKYVLNSGNFVDTGQPCRYDFGSGFVDAQYVGYSCIAGGCSSDSDCSGGEVCDLSTNTCVAPSLPAPYFNLSLAPTPISIYPGQTATATVTITSENNDIDDISLADGSILPANTTTGFSPSGAVPLGANQTATSTYIISTTNNTPPGSYSLSVYGQGATTSTTSNPITLVVNAYTPTFVITPSSASVAVGSSQQFTAIYDPDGPSGPAPPTTVTASASWSSNNTSVATMDATPGQADAIAAGSAGIIATYGGITTQPSILNVTAPVDFILNVSPSTQNSPPSSTATYQVTITPIGGFSAPVILSVNNLPSGVTGSFDKVSIKPGNTATLTLNISSSAGIGVSTFTVSGQHGATTHNQTADINVTAPLPTITNVAVSCVPSSIFVNQTSVCTATVSGIGSYSSAVTWSYSGGGSINPSGATANYTAPGAPTTATVTATSQQDPTQSGSAPITVTANPTHSECVNNTCTSVSGVGPNRCSNDAECGGGPPGNKNKTYGMCDAAQNACVNVVGNGSDTCSDASCGGGGPGYGSHFGCQNDACLVLSGSGANTCTSDADCVPPPAPTCTLTANPLQVIPPETSTVSWVCNNAVSCTLNGASMAGHESVSGSTLTGSIAEAPTPGNNTYLLSCSNSIGTPTSTQVTVDVKNPNIIEVPPQPLSQ